MKDETSGTRGGITGGMTVREVAGRWPACARVLEGVEGARVGGRWTLQEVGALARARGVGEEGLVQELAGAAGVAVGSSREKGAAAVAAARQASPVPVIFVALAVGVTLGAGWGVMLLLKIAGGADYSAVSGASVHVHGVAQLWGWMALFVFGVGTHLLRQNTKRPAPAWLERVAAGVVIVGLVGFFVGLGGRVRDVVPRIDVAASGLLAAGAVLMGVAVIWSLAGAGKGQRRHGFVFLVGWLWAWAATDLWLRVHYPGEVLPDGARRLLIVLPVLGLATNAIYGFGIKLLPGLLNLARLRQGWLSGALMLHNGGLCLYLVPRRWAQVVGAAAMLAGAVAYLAGMGGLKGKPSRPIYGIDPRGNVLIRVAFFWLVAGLAMVLGQAAVGGEAPHAYSGAWRHALTVGFVTTMILGVGQRIVPVFVRQPIASTRLMLAGAALIVAGNAGRVGLELATIGGWRWAYRVMGVTGLLELTALVLFAGNLVATVRRRRRVYRRGEALTPDVRVREAINERPELQVRLGELGITMFDRAAFVAPSMTLGALALASGREPWGLVGELDGPAAKVTRH